MNNNQRGFSAAEALAFIIIVGIIVGTGWYVWKSNNPNSSQKPPVTSYEEAKPEPKNGVITDGPGEDWNTYTNNEVGFSIKIPKNFLASSGSECSKLDEIYVINSGEVPSLVIEDGNNFYLTNEYSYKLHGETENGFTGGCEKVNTTTNVVRAYENGEESGLSLDVLPWSVVEVKNQTDILTWARNFFDEGSITVSSVKDNLGGWQDVALKAKTDPSGTPFFNFKYELRHYQDKNRLVYMTYGQSYKIYKDQDNTHDEEIFNSFKFIN